MPLAVSNSLGCNCCNSTPIVPTFQCQNCTIPAVPLTAALVLATCDDAGLPNKTGAVSYSVTLNPVMGQSAWTGTFNAGVMHCLGSSNFGGNQLAAGPVTVNLVCQHPSNPRFLTIVFTTGAGATQKQAGYWFLNNWSSCSPPFATLHNSGGPVGNTYPLMWADITKAQT